MALNTHIMNESEEPEYVYESPDGGETIYRRVRGEHKRELIKGDPEKQLKLLERKAEWAKIIHQAENDLELQKLINQVEIYYKLKYDTEI